MIEIISEKFFHLHNGEISYLFYVMQNGQLGHLYFGADLGELSEDDCDYLMAQDSKSAGTVKFSPTMGNFNLADRAQEYPVYGSSDFKEGAIDVLLQDEPWYLDFKYIGYQLRNSKPRDLSHPATYAIGDHEAQTIIIQLRDEEHRLQLTESFTIFRNQNAIARSQRLSNYGDETVTIHKMMSGALDLPNADYQFMSLSGAWLKERQPKFRSLTQGTVSVASLRGASSHQHNPFIALAQSTNLNSGIVYAANLVYSGNFLSQVEVDKWQKSRLLIGIHPDYFDWKLASGDSFTTPEAVLFFSKTGLDGLIKTTQKFNQYHISDREWLRRRRPVVLNNWEATYFDFNEDKLLQLAKDAKKLGMECFVIDDGWFGHRNTDRTSLGDWSVNAQKFPHGIANFAQKIHDLGMSLGLWFEPEMVSLDTALYKEHPDWIVRQPYTRNSIGRGQYVLDFANPDVVQAIYNQMELVIKAAHLDYIKWDMNRNITEAYSHYLKKQHLPQTEFFHRYILGVYSLYQKLLTQFPDLLIEGCAGGGGRFDLGILFYSPQIWPSDDSDAVERLTILSGTTLAYPLSAFSNHVSAVPNDQDRRVTSLALRQAVCDFGPLGYELDLNKLTSNEKKNIKKNVAFYKHHRDLLVNGHFQQLLPFTHDQNTVAWGVVNDEKTEAFIGFYRKMAEPNPSVLEYLKVPFVDENKIYQIDDQEKVSGKVLQRSGLREPYQFDGVNGDTAQVQGDGQAWMFHLLAQ